MTKKNERFLIVLILALSVSAAVLMLTLPALFGAYATYQLWIAAVAGGLTVMFAAALVLVKPPRLST